MEIIKKLDKSNRICISAEIRDLLGWSINDKIRLQTTDKNEIILTKVENSSEDILEVPKAESRLDAALTLLNNVSKEELDKINKAQEQIIDNLKVEPKNNFFDYYDELSNTKCVQCSNKIGDSRFKYNRGYICKPCRNKLRDRLIRDIQLRKIERMEEDYE